ncbi:capsule assembly Wzi family protein [Roseivirga echinicomitans]
MRKYILILLTFLSVYTVAAQTIPMGSPVIEEYLRRQQLLGNFDNSFSFNFRPINFGVDRMESDPSVFDANNYFKTVGNYFNGKGVVKLLPAELHTTFDSHHPYSRNDGAMIRSKGLQTQVRAGIYTEVGPLSIQLKPEFVFAQNQDYEGFPDSFDDQKWAQRYVWFNTIDEPERYGTDPYAKVGLGQSSLRLNKWGMSLGVSTENIWWGPAQRNSIMMSNNAKGFSHITFNTTRPQKTPIGNFEWQIATGRLESSGFTPPDTGRIDRQRKLYIPKKDDWRYFQGLSVSYSPKWISGLSLGVTRWVQAYSEFVINTKDYMPAFSNLFRNNDDNTGGRNEIERDQAAGLFLRWLWLDSKAEIYMEFHRNDASANFRDLILDSDHTRATTIGIHKLFDTDKKDEFIQLNWEWTQMEQTGGRLLRNGLSWYIHHRVRHGYTNNGEVLGASIGPGSNVHYLSAAWVKGMNRVGIAFERLAHNNDFLYFAFEDSYDFRRYWVDYNFHAFADWKFDKLMVSGNVFYTRALNYQWELFHVPYTQPYYVPGTDVGNLHLEFKLAYLL